jgi:threonine/homoserine/homoserine lactone efflux protein
VLLIALGVHFYRKRQTVAETPPPSGVGNKRSFFLGFTITALNPTLIATWTFTVTTVYSFGLVKFDSGNALPFSLGAFSGIVGWFATLLYLLNRFRTTLPGVALNKVLNVMGIVLIVVGVAIGVTVTRPYVTGFFG